MSWGLKVHGTSQLGLMGGIAQLRVVMKSHEPPSRVIYTRPPPAVETSVRGKAEECKP